MSSRRDVTRLVAAVLLLVGLGCAPPVVALGPGFEAGRDAHAVVETNRGYDLGRVIFRGSAEANTGMPGLIAGEDRGREELSRLGETERGPGKGGDRVVSHRKAGRSSASMS